MLMGSVAIGWELYERTQSPFALGLVGLVQVLPVIALSLPAGQIADRYDRKRIVLFSQYLLAVCALGLALLTATRGPLPVVYFLLFLTGVSRAFSGPARSTLIPQTVPPEVFTSAATWSSSSWQLAAVAGPGLAGLGIALSGGATAVFLAEFGMTLAMIGTLSLIRLRPIALAPKGTTLSSLLAGAGFVWRTKVIMAAITLDLFAVLFGGAVALLPVYAKDILDVGPTGLGWLRAAPSIGAVAMVILLSHLPPIGRAGPALLWSVAGFGVATVVFGLSTSFWLSMAMLALIGAFDNISVVIRSTLLLVRTPDEMRGRVSAVNMMFISISNEMGAFESGLVAAWLGPILAVVSGGIGTLLAVGLVALIWPEVRRLGKMDEPAPAEAPAAEAVR
jgi:MFS family permease